MIAGAAPGAQGFDTDTVLDAPTAMQLAQAGFQFAVRYLSRIVPQNGGDLSAAEISAITGAGLALMAVQHVARPGWGPTLALGASYGHAAAANAAAIGLPFGMTVWLDLEGVAPWSTSADTIAYVNTWAGEVAAGGYEPGIYVGANQPLTGDELYWRLKVSRYWRSASRVADISYRGYCMAQALMPAPIDGGGGISIDIDRNVIMADAFGGLPNWLAPGA